MKIGIDIIYIPEFKRKMKSIDLKTVFLETELKQNRSVESLAGIFAAKESFFKAIGKKENWNSVWLEKNKLGQPSLNSTLLSPLQERSVSISHDGDYAIAIVFIG